MTNEHAADDAAPVPDVPRLALRPADAARALGIGQRLLWSLTASGSIPHVKLGRATLYPVDGLRVWLDEQTRGAAR